MARKKIGAKFKMAEGQETAKKEILQTLRISDIFMRVNGISFLEEAPSFLDKLRVQFKFMIAVSLVISKLISEIAYTASLLVGSVTVEELIGGYVHIAGYDTLSVGKLLMVGYQKQAFKQLAIELPDIWPRADVDAASVEIKRSSLKALRVMQTFYAGWTVFGVWVYNLTPIGLYLYHISRGEPAVLGYIWHLYYPFEHSKPVPHMLVYLYELISGLYSVNAMLSADILFITMASHISMLLRLLQVKIRRIGTPQDAHANERWSQDNYDEIVDVVKIHQRLISYGNDMENAFTVVNLLNVMLSSVNICCVVFSIVFLEPVMEMSNKFYIGATLTQMGIVCWYAHDIYTASVGVSDAVYESGWYRCDPRSRRALLVMLQRSQRPLYFTALKFRSITMITYSSILTTAYSYFTLLYSSYRRD